MCLDSLYISVTASGLLGYRLTADTTGSSAPDRPRLKSIQDFFWSGEKTVLSDNIDPRIPQVPDLPTYIAWAAR